jgi:hypothetical protein
VADHEPQEGDQMPDDPNPDQEPGKDDPGKQEPGKQDEQEPPWGSDEEFDPGKAWKLIQDVRGDLSKIKAERDDYKTKAQQFEDASKSDAQKLEEKATTSEQRAAKAEQEAARLRVALKKGLSETQAKRLVGDSEEDLEKDADELLASFKTDDDDGDQASQRRPRERLRPGAAPSSEPEETDPTKLAAAVPRPY